MQAMTLKDPVALWTAKQGTKTGKSFPANTKFEYRLVDGTWVELLDGQWMNGGTGWQYIKLLPTEPPPPNEKTLTNTIRVFNDGSIDVTPA